MRGTAIGRTALAASRRVAFCLLAAAYGSWGGERPAGLEFRRILSVKDGLVADSGTPIPRDAVRVFAYEGAPVGVYVTDEHIAVDYRRTGVLFERATGRPVRRFTVADGWPDVWSEPFGEPRDRWAERKLVGPGVWDQFAAPRQPAADVVVASVTFQGRQWRACQPRGLLSRLTKLSWKRRREDFGAWTPILRKFNQASYVEAAPEPAGQARRFTMEDGLAGNIVAHFAVAHGALWAACVDLYDRERERWGPGGLCRFDPKTSRWRRIDKIDGRPVRWVTLLHTVGDELWVGFREGSGVAGDRVLYGMGIFAGSYRPHTKAIVVARLAKDAWSSFSRPPATDLPRRWDPERKEEDPPTEKPCFLSRSGDRVILLSRARSRRRGNWGGPLDGHVSVLDLETKQWQALDVHKDFDADVLNDMIAEDREVLVTSNRGVHRWDPNAQTWRFLDPRCDLRNPALSAVTAVGDELWVGYTNQSFGVIGPQGISRFSEKTQRWTHVLPKELGTACPVRQIAALPGGEVWVLFKPRPWMGAAEEFMYYPREGQTPRPTGLARFAGGKWAFPVELDGVPDSVDREIKLPTRPGARPRPNGRKFYVKRSKVVDLLAMGDKLFVVTHNGLYVGPEKWEKVIDGPVRNVRPSKDRKVLLLACRDPTRPSHPDRLIVARYDPASGETKWGAAPARPEQWDVLNRGRPSFGDGPGNRWKWEWVHVPTSKAGDWVVGPFAGYGTHKYVLTPSAVWIASSGELVRLDRKRLAEWLGK